MDNKKASIEEQEIDKIIELKDIDKNKSSSKNPIVKNLMSTLNNIKEQLDQHFIENS